MREKDSLSINHVLSVLRRYLPSRFGSSTLFSTTMSGSRSRDQDPSWVAGGSRSFRRDSKMGYLKCVRKHRRQKSSIRFSFIKFLPSMLSPSLSQIFIFKMSHAQRYSPRTRKGRLQTRGSRHVPRSVHYRGHSPAARCSCQAGDWDAFQWNGG